MTHHRPTFTLLATVQLPTGTAREYAVGVRHGVTTWTEGRVAGAPGSWRGLAIGARAWTLPYATRGEAVAAMLAGITYLDPTPEEWEAWEAECAAWLAAQQPAEGVPA